MYDALLTSGFLRETEIADLRWPGLLRELEQSDRAIRTVIESKLGGGKDASSRIVWIALERCAEWRAVHPESVPRRAAAAAATVERDVAVRELLRSRLEVIGPATADALAESIQIPVREVDAALVTIEAQGTILRGSFTPGGTGREWCDRRLLARIHRYTLNRLRAEIQPVSPADYMRFLFRWQHVEEDCRADGLEGLAAIARQLEGFEMPAVAWEGDVLPLRTRSYSPELLDALCLSGRLLWARLSLPNGSASFTSGLLRSSPIALLLRTNSDAWLPSHIGAQDVVLSPGAADIHRVLSERGACFFHELVGLASLLPARVEEALSELVALGLVTADSYGGLRALLTPDRHGSTTQRRNANAYSIETAGRWSSLRRAAPAASALPHGDGSIENRALTLLDRYGVVFRRVLTRETNAPSWRDLVRVYRRLEGRGVIRGGRFVAGFAGEQFALPEAVAKLRAVRRQEPQSHAWVISAADPLNLSGIITPGERIPALAGNRIVYRGGVPVAALRTGTVSWLANLPESDMPQLERMLTRRHVPPQLRPYLRNRRPTRRSPQPQTQH
jgi:ATP-dependent Lhr-like helicase